jgi:single-strand DNA-binding protein
VYEPTIALGGHLGRDPELRYTPNGVPVCDLSVATSPRVKVGEEWQDRGETLWFKVSCWRALAEHVAASFKKGDRVLVQGRLLQQTYQRQDGTTGVSMVVDAGLVGADVSRYPIEVKRPVRAGSTADLMPEKWVDQATGEIVSGPAGSGPLVPFDDVEPVDDEAPDEVAA